MEIWEEVAPARERGRETYQECRQGGHALPKNFQKSWNKCCDWHKNYTKNTNVFSGNFSFWPLPKMVWSPPKYFLATPLRANLQAKLLPNGGRWQKKKPFGWKMWKKKQGRCHKNLVLAAAIVTQEFYPSATAPSKAFNIFFSPYVQSYSQKYLLIKESDSLFSWHFIIYLLLLLPSDAATNG